MKAILTLGLICLLPALVLAGNDGPRGADGIEIRKQLLEKTIKEDLKETVKTYAKSIDPQGIVNRDLRAIYLSLLSQGFLDDLENSVDEPQEICKDIHGVEKSATSNLNERNGPICWNIPLLAETNHSLSELVGIKFHENAHHFGLEDADNKIATYFTADFLKWSMVKNFNEAIAEQSGAKPNDNLQFFLRKAAVEGGVANEKILTSDWILVENADSRQNGSEKMEAIVKQVVERNQEANPDYRIKILSTESQFAQVIEQEKGSSNGNSISFQTRDETIYRNYKSCLIYEDSAFKRINASDYYHDYSARYKTLVRYVVHYRQTLDSLSNSDYETARVELTRAYEAKIEKISSRLQACLRVSNQVIPVAYLYKELADDEGKYAGGRVGPDLLKPCLSITTYERSPSYAPDEIIFDDYDVIKNSDTSGLEAKVDALIQSYSGTVQDLLYKEFELAEEAYETATKKGLPEEVAADIVRKFTRQRDYVFKQKKGLVKRRFKYELDGEDNSRKYTDTKTYILDEENYARLLLPNESPKAASR